MAKRTKVTLAAAAPVETLAVPFMAQAFGEFEKENLDVRAEPSLLTADAIGLLEAGSLDALWGSVGGALLNSINNGINVKVVAPAGATTVGSRKKATGPTRSLLERHAREPEEDQGGLGHRCGYLPRAGAGVVARSQRR
ncbi:hypothetical protein [Aeromicrobium sp. UC242_57]|uniref:hypothetical protein n=1 Tax=Aeromicrobium sp. UC242_57 TaxID=3374624 RepID=UPI0037A3A266